MSKERDLLKEWVSSYIAREGLNDSYREPISLAGVYRETMSLLAQPEEEPVAWKDRTYGNLHHVDWGGDSIPLYTSPPQREGLDLDIKDFHRGFLSALEHAVYVDPQKPEQEQEQEQEQEPVAWIDVGSLKGLQESTGYALRYLTNDIDNLKPTDVPLYLAPPTRKPLSEYEITEACLLKGQDYVSAFIDGVEFAEKHYRITGVDDGH